MLGLCDSSIAAGVGLLVVVVVVVGLLVVVEVVVVLLVVGSGIGDFVAVGLSG